MTGYCKLLVLILVSQHVFGTDDDDDDDVALTMEIAIESLNGRQKAELIPHSTSEKNCLSGVACQNGGICRNAAVQSDGTIIRGACVCPLGYFGPLCTKKVQQSRFPELLDGGFLVFNGHLLPKEGPFSVRMQIKPYIFRPHTLIFFHNSSTRKQAFYLELNNQLIQLRVYNKSKAGHFYLSRLLQHSLKLQNANADFFDIAFGLVAPDEFRLSVNQHEVHSHIEDIPPESKTDHAMGSFSNEHEIYIGGHLTLTLGNPFPIVSAAENSLIGCVGDVNINGHLCDPRQSSFVGDATGGFGVVDCARNVCNQHACEGSSFCKPVSSTEYACQCPIGTRPPWCKQDRIPVIPEFLGNSYLSVRGFRATSWTETLLEMTFLPKKPTGLIIYSGFSFDKRGDFICVALVNGKIVVSVDLGRGPSFKKSAQNLTLNSWHTLRVKRRGRSFDIYLSGQHTSSGPEIFTQGSFVQLTIMDELYVGGIPNPDRISAYLPEYQELVSYKSARGFSGCVQSLIINGLRVDLVEDFIEFVNIVNCEMHECAKRFPPCGFNGKCIALSHTWKCICKAGLGGPKCEKNLLRAFNSRIAFDAYSFLTIEPPKPILPKLTPTLKISANISKSKLGDSYEIIFTIKFESTSRVQCIFVGMQGNGSSLGLDIWDLPIGWPPDRPISSSFVNYQSNFSRTRLLPAKWYTITLSRNHNALRVYVNGKSCLTMNILHFANHFYNRATSYVGGAPQSIIDKFDFLQEMHPAIKKKGQIGGFVGCIGDIKLMDSPIRLTNVTQSQNIDYCLDEIF